MNDLLRPKTLKPRLPSETDYLHDFIARSAIVFRDVRVIRRNTGAVRIPTLPGEKQRFFHSGKAGQCDTYAIGRGGLHYELEGKSLHGQLNPAQKRWRDWCVSWEIPWMLLRPMPGEQPTETVQRWCDECFSTWGWR